MHRLNTLVTLSIAAVKLQVDPVQRGQQRSAQKADKLRADSPSPNPGRAFCNNTKTHSLVCPSGKQVIRVSYTTQYAIMYKCYEGKLANVAPS